MTMLRNTSVEQNWGAIPVTDCGLDGSGNLQIAALNQDLTILPSATRTATTNSAAQVNQNGQGLAVYLNVSAASGTGGLKVLVQAQDPSSGNWGTVFVATTAVTATGTYVYLVFPGIASGGTQAYSSLLPATWRIEVQHNDSSNYTYSVGASVIL